MANEMTRVEQEARIEQVNQRINGATLTRAEYEAMAAELGIEVASDRECDSYGVKFGEFYLPEYDAEYIVRKALMRARMRGIEAEEKAEKAARRAAREAARLDTADCGHSCHPDLIMYGSVGTVCPDCYDKNER